MPSTPYEAKGMMVAAICDDNPVIILEHRWIHYAEGEVPLPLYQTPLIGPALVRQGDDVTIVASSLALLEVDGGGGSYGGRGGPSRSVRPKDPAPIRPFPDHRVGKGAPVGW